MRIAIFGTGGVGAYFGGRLAQAGNDVTFIARGKQLDAIIARGLQVHSINGSFAVHPAKATDRPSGVGVVDLVLCCVKAYQVPEVAEEMRHLVGPGTMVMTLQNGVEAHIALSRTIHSRHILPGVCKIISMLEAPGIIRHESVEPSLTFGEMDGSLTPRVEHLVKLFSDSHGVTVYTSRNILSVLWKKLMLMAPWGGLGALSRSPIGVIRKMPETREMLLTSVREVYAVARATGIVVDEKAIDATMGFIDHLAPGATTSMQRDIMEARRSELNEQCGAVVRFGDKGGVSTPLSRFIYHSLLPLEGMARGEIAI